MKNCQKLLEIMAQLRNPETGCPWDIEQNFTSIASHTIEEAYEVADAITRNDMHELKEELGDLLLQVVFHSQMAQEQEIFTFEDVASTINDKLIARHPHVFDNVAIESAEEQEALWEELKAKERAESALKNNRLESILDNIPKGFPPLKRAVKLQKRAAQVGFDWSDIPSVFGKLHEELDELSEAVTQQDKEAMIDELGDVLFSVCNVGRKLKIDPEAALRQVNHKFEQRFNFIEDKLRQNGEKIEETSLEEMDKLWNEAKENGL